MGYYCQELLCHNIPQKNTDTMRIQIPGDPISVAYGYDGVTGVFLSVTDKRLAYNPDSSKKVNAVTESVGVGDGGGSYFSLHTGTHGFGTKVDDETMATFLKRYGVTAERISELPLKISAVDWTSVEPGNSTRVVGSTKVCTSCRCKTSSCKDCTMCSNVPYCAKECQKKDWHIHKIFCGLHGQEPLPPSNGTFIVVKAFLFPADSETPVFVNLPLEQVDRDAYDVTSTSKRLNCNEFISGATDSIRSDLFTDAAIRSLPQAYHVIYKSDFGKDDTEINKCVLKLFKKYEKKTVSVSVPKDPHWRNNILVVKVKPGDIGNKSYQDISIADATEVVKFLYKYTSSHGLIVSSSRGEPGSSKREVGSAWRNARMSEKKAKGENDRQVVSSSKLEHRSSKSEVGSALRNESMSEKKAKGENYGQDYGGYFLEKGRNIFTLVTEFFAVALACHYSTGCLRFFTIIAISLACQSSRKKANGEHDGQNGGDLEKGVNIFTLVEELVFVIIATGCRFFATIAVALVCDYFTGFLD